MSTSELDNGGFAPWHYQVLKLLFISVLYWFHIATSWTKMAATAPAITSAIQPARRRTFLLRTLPRQYTNHFHSYPIGQNWVTWPHTDARETWAPVIMPSDEPEALRKVSGGTGDNWWLLPQSSTIKSSSFHSLLKTLTWRSHSLRIKFRILTQPVKSSWILSQVLPLKSFRKHLSLCQAFAHAVPAVRNIICSGRCLLLLLFHVIPFSPAGFSVAVLDWSSEVKNRSVVSDSFAPYGL